MSIEAAKNASGWDLLKFRVLSVFPGTTGERYKRKLRQSNWRETDAAFSAAQRATAGKVAIDLGANVGEFTRRLSEHASHVYAFEPDPWTVERLTEAVAGLENVTVIPAAAGAEAGTFSLYRHVAFGDNKMGNSQVSSLLSEAKHIDGGVSVEVEVKDLCAFILERDLDVGILKIDVEGSEVALLEALLDSPAASRIDYIFCETHEFDFPSLRPRFKALRRRVAGLAAPRVNLDWH